MKIHRFYYHVLKELIEEAQGKRYDINQIRTENDL
jgi:hypothetical protein